MDRELLKILRCLKCKSPLITRGRLFWCCICDTEFLAEELDRYDEKIHQELLEVRLNDGI